ncbi:MAG: hypothetical protein LBK73_06250 [Treponema sp.]|nr:hypothetical protein [Treponema sp.]
MLYKKAPRSLLFFLTIAFGLSAGTLIWAQESGFRSGFRIGDDGRFMQTLGWEEQENVLYYEVEIEKRAGELWEEFIREKTERAFFEVSLAPGMYRYRVRPYDFLEKPGQAAAWAQFEILEAKQPEIFRFSPESFYMDEDVVWNIDIFGRNLANGIGAYLQGQQGKRIIPRMARAEQQEDRVRLGFSYTQLDVGVYTIHVTNPGGLTAELGPFRIAFKKLLDINVSAGYKPTFPLYGRINELFDTAFFPIGAYIRLSVIPFKRSWGYIGFELEPSWSYFLIAREGYKIQLQMPGGTLYGVYQKWFSNRIMALNFRIGAGIHSIVGYRFIFNAGETEPMASLMPAIAAGLSFQWFVRKPFFVEAGMDFTHLFTADNPPPGYLRLFAGAGWQF